MRPLARLASSPCSNWVEIVPRHAEIRAGDIVQFSSAKDGSSMRVGNARVVENIDGALRFDMYLNTVVPAVASDDYVYEYKEPCRRCRCEECEAAWAILGGKSDKETR